MVKLNITAYSALHRVGCNFDKETVIHVVKDVKCFKNLYYNIGKMQKQLSINLDRLSSLLKMLPFNILESLRNHACSNILKILQSKKANFLMKTSDIFHISSQNIDCGYSLEPPRRGGSNKYYNLCF